LKKKMIIITCLIFLAFAISLPSFIITKNAVLEAITISIGITLYHFIMRLSVGVVVNIFMKNNANHNNFWFREKNFEKKLYKFLHVRKWKKYLPTYDLDTFNVDKKTIEEIIGATCQAEVVHQIIMVFSLLPITLIPILGGAIVIIITSILSMLFDCLFVILQRYNRPRLVKVMQRHQKVANVEK